MAKIVHIAIHEGFCFLFISGVLFQTTMWMLSLASCHFFGTFIKQLECQYLGAVPRDVNTMQNSFPFAEISLR